jgi:hypothetical protein
LTTQIQTGERLSNELTAGARKSVSELEKVYERLTTKLWTGMILASLLVSAVAVSTFCVWQRNHSDEKNIETPSTSNPPQERRTWR